MNTAQTILIHTLLLLAVLAINSTAGSLCITLPLLILSCHHAQVQYICQVLGYIKVVKSTTTILSTSSATAISSPTTTLELRTIAPDMPLLTTLITCDFSAAPLVLEPTQDHGSLTLIWMVAILRNVRKVSISTTILALKTTTNTTITTNIAATDTTTKMTTRTTNRTLKTTTNKTTSNCTPTQTRTLIVTTTTFATT